MRKNAKLFLAVIALSLLMAGTAFAGSWQQDNIGYWYLRDDGSYPKDSWMQDADGSWYCFNSDGYMRTGWHQENGEWYYLEPSGRMATGVKEINEGIYRFESTSGKLIETVRGTEPSAVEHGNSNNGVENDICGRYEMRFNWDGGAELEVSRKNDGYYAVFSGSSYYHSGWTEGALFADNDGSNGVWFVLDEYSNAYSLKLEYDGKNSIVVTSLDGDNHGGMQFPGFSGSYTRV